MLSPFYNIRLLMGMNECTMHCCFLLLLSLEGWALGVVPKNSLHRCDKGDYSMLYGGFPVSVACGVACVATVRRTWYDARAGKGNAR